jgi:nitrous oxidase accessory protein NosD
MAATLRCGDAVTADTVLTADVTGCGATGLVVAADGVTLDLNGHTVSGHQLGFGIVVSGRRNVTIRNGTVSHFRVGVSADDSTDVTARDLALTDGHDGVNFFRVTRGTIARSSFSGNDASAIFPRTSTGIRVLDNRAWGNAAGFSGGDLTGGVVSGNEVWGQTYYGLIFLDVTGLTFAGNRFERNGTLGMQVGGDSSGNLVTRTRAWRNGGDGIAIEAGGATLTRNSAFFNGGFGIAAPGATDGGGNHAKHNGAPLECAGVACK